MRCLQGPNRRGRRVRKRRQENPEPGAHRGPRGGKMQRLCRSPRPGRGDQHRRHRPIRRFAGVLRRKNREAHHNSSANERPAHHNRFFRESGTRRGAERQKARGGRHHPGNPQGNRRLRAGKMPVDRLLPVIQAGLEDLPRTSGSRPAPLSGTIAAIPSKSMPTGC